jgi:DNA-binding transcriptional LysR family regulator
MRVEIREVEAFLAVADELHFGRAAQRLGVSAASVSQAIGALERRVGTLLFARTSRQVALTPVGGQLLARFRAGYDELLEGVREAQQAGGVRYPELLRAGFSATVPEDLAARMAAAFELRAPAWRFVRSCYQTAEVFSWIEAGKFVPDVFVTWLPDPESGPAPAPQWVAVSVLFRQARVALMSAAHPLAGRSSVDVEELADHVVFLPCDYGPYNDGWVPPLTPGGRRMRRLPPRRAAYLEDLPDVLADGGIIHLTVAPTASAVIGPDRGLVSVPVTGIPPLACAVLWPKAGGNPMARVFADAAADVADG